MKKRLLLFFSLLFFVSSSILLSNFYTVTDLGAMGPPQTAYSSAYSINDNGAVVGFSTTDSGERAFLYASGAMIEISLSHKNSYASKINNNGVVVGHESDGKIFKWEAGAHEYIGGGSYSVSINNNDVIAARDGSGTFTYSNGLYEYLGFDANVSDINDNGIIVGTILIDELQRGYYTSGGMPIVIGTLGGESSSASAINNNGLVVGSSLLENGSRRAFLYDGLQMIELGTLSGADNFAYDINDSGTIVGSESGTAFVYKDGIMHDLNSLLVNGSGWQLASAQSINDTGQIVGIGINPDGRTRAFLLDPTPIPEPMTFSLILGCCVLFTSLSLRHKRYLRA